MIFKFFSIKKKLVKIVKFTAFKRKSQCIPTHEKAY